MPKHKKASANTRKKGVSTTQVDRIRTLSHEGKSANQIQRTLSKEHIGMRRTTLLPYVREFKGKQPQTNVSKYTPTKYRKRITRRHYEERRTHRHRERYLKPESLATKHVTIKGKDQHGKQKTIELSGIGRDLFEAIKDDIIKYAPKQQFLTIGARELLSNPDKFLSKEKWDQRPRINS